MFTLTSESIDSKYLRQELHDKSVGALVVFEGWVRDHNQGEEVTSLEYEAYSTLCESEAQNILNEAQQKFHITDLYIVHRTGHLELGEIAVWIGAMAHHRDDAFRACRYAIDEIKSRLPIWKKEHYKNSTPRWVYCRDHDHHVHFCSKDYYQKQNALIDQSKLAQARVLIVGAGGLGCPVLQALTMAGVGEITLLDFDKIEITNIHRQPLYSPQNVGEFKAIIAQKKMQEMNPFIQIKSQVDYLDADNIATFFDGCHFVIDCTDNLETKNLINRACHYLNIPFVTASIYQHEGILRTIVPELKNGCTSCFQSSGNSESILGNCNDFGVLGAHLAILGSMQASQAIEFLNGGAQSCQQIIRSTLLLNFRTLEWTKIKNSQDEDCPVCTSVMFHL